MKQGGRADGISVHETAVIQCTFCVVRCSFGPVRKTGRFGGPRYTLVVTGSSRQPAGTIEFMSCSPAMYESAAAASSRV